MAILAIVLVVIIMTVVAIFLITGLMTAPFVPSHKKGVETALTDLYHITRDDVLIDLGAGNGIVLEQAAKLGARAIGVEVNPILAFLIRLRRNKLPKKEASKIKIMCKNFYRMEFPKDTTVVYTFATSLYIKPIYQKIQSEATRLKKPIYFISNAFDVPGVQAEKKIGAHYLYKALPG